VALSEATRAKILAELDRYPRRRSALLPALRHAQDEVGYLPQEVLSEVGDLLAFDPNALAMLVTFYDLLHAGPVGKRVLSVCDGLACHLLGSGEVIDAIGRHLGIHLDETTADGNFTLNRMECLAACHIAPCLIVNGEDYVGDLRADSVALLLTQLQPSPGERPQFIGATPFPARAGAQADDDSTGAGRESPRRE